MLKTYEDWLALSDEERHLVHFREWKEHDRDGIPIAMMAATRCALQSKRRILDIGVLSYHLGEYLLQLTVSVEDYQDCAPMLSETFEGFRVLWSPARKFTAPSGIQGSLEGTWRVDQGDWEFQLHWIVGGVAISGRVLSTGEDLLIASACLSGEHDIFSGEHVLFITHDANRQEGMQHVLSLITPIRCSDRTARMEYYTRVEAMSPEFASGMPAIRPVIDPTRPPARPTQCSLTKPFKNSNLPALNRAVNTYDDWLSLSDEQQQHVHFHEWNVGNRDGIAIAFMAAARRAIQSKWRVLNIQIGLYHFNEYILLMKVSADDYRDCPRMLEERFEGFRVFWLPERTMFMSAPIQGTLEGTWRAEQGDYEFQIHFTAAGVAVSGRVMSTGEVLAITDAEQIFASQAISRDFVRFSAHETSRKASSKHVLSLIAANRCGDETTRIEPLERVQ